MTTFACITTCKDRRSHLVESLPAMLSAGFDEVIVVDFDCPQLTAEWCRATYPEVKAIKVHDQPFFNLAKARNIGAENALSKWLCFVDADLYPAGHFGSWLRANAGKGNFYSFDQYPGKKREKARGLAGTLVCEQAAFNAVGGYDELLSGWGYEDIEIQLKLRQAGYFGKLLPVDAIRARIEHDNEMRLRHYRSKNKRLSNLRNKFYSTAKLTLTTAFGLGVRLPVAIREDLNRGVTEIAKKWDPADLGAIQSIELDMPKGIRALLEREGKDPSALKECSSRKFVVKIAYEKRLRRDLFSRMPSFLQNMRSGLR